MDNFVCLPCPWVSGGPGPHRWGTSCVCSTEVHHGMCPCGKPAQFLSFARYSQTLNNHSVISDILWSVLVFCKLFVFNEKPHFSVHVEIRKIFMAVCFLNIPGLLRSVSCHLHALPYPTCTVLFFFRSARFARISSPPFSSYFPLLFLSSSFFFFNSFFSLYCP